MQTIHVATKNGRAAASLLGRFSQQVEGCERRFAVTWLPGAPEPAVTLLPTGQALCFIPMAALAAATGDYVIAGQNELTRALRAAGYSTQVEPQSGWRWATCRVGSECRCAG